MSSFTDYLKDLVTKIVPESTDQAINDKILELVPEITPIAEKVVVTFEDGFQWTDIPQIAAIVPEVYALAKNINEWDLKQKEEFTVETVWFIYKAVDTYPDGKSNNINVPWLIGGAEEWAERKAIDFGVRFAFNAIAEKIK